MMLLRLERHQVHDVDDPDGQIRSKLACRICTAASVSSVGTSPAQAITTSGSLPFLVEAQSQMPIPARQ